jgi:hypothetical protein
MIKWVQIFTGILLTLFFPLAFALAVWWIEKAGRRRALPALHRWIRFTAVSAVTFLIASSILTLPLRLRFGIPTTNTLLMALSYDAFAGWFITYYITMVGVGVGVVGIVFSAIIAKLASRN